VQCQYRPHRHADSSDAEPAEYRIGKVARTIAKTLTMSPVTHFLSGWVLANAGPLNRRERAAVTLAAVVPDIDGVGVIAEILTRNSAHRLLWFSEYHHVLHNLLFGLIVAGVAGAVATKRWLPPLGSIGSFPHSSSAGSGWVARPGWI
jgi:hypothetical protein